VVVGNFYTNVTVRGIAQEGVVAAVDALGYRAFVSHTTSGLTVVCEEESDAQDELVWRGVAKQLSERLNCEALAVMNHDDDILVYALYRNGKLLDEYNSCPDYWEEEDEPGPPTGGDVRALCEALGMPGNAAEAERILREPADSDEFLFAFRRHEALLKALDWPDVPCQQGFTYIKEVGEAVDWRAVG
jgi:hypothetical protein